MTQRHAGRRRAWGALIALTLCLAQPEPAGAQGPYGLDPGREWTLLGIGAGLNLGGLALVGQIDPFTPAQLATLDASSINSLDRSGMEPYRADVAGDALQIASLALPFTLLADERTRHDWKTLGVMWSEVLLLNSGCTALAKGLFERTRPYAYDNGAPLEERTDKDAKVSFYSGHTSTTAANCFFVARVVSDYPFSTTTKTIAWSAAAVYPAVVGFLRVDSGHHFRTDVITGYLVGASIGILVPQLHRAARNQDASSGASVAGGRLVLTFKF